MLWVSKGVKVSTSKTSFSDFNTSLVLVGCYYVNIVRYVLISFVCVTSLFSKIAINVTHNLVVAQLVRRLLPTPEDPGSNPVIEMFFNIQFCKLCIKMKPLKYGCE